MLNFSHRQFNIYIMHCIDTFVSISILHNLMEYNWINVIECFFPHRKIGMGKEVENLISENTELLATKYVFHTNGTCICI